jgi:hypothetical protein
MRGIDKGRSTISEQSHRRQDNFVRQIVLLRQNRSLQQSLTVSTIFAVVALSNLNKKGGV